MMIGGHEIRCVVLGASAGGVDAINFILGKFHRPLTVPLLITLHVAPHSIFIEEAFRGADSTIQIKEVADKEVLLPGKVYFAPADYHVLLERQGHVSLSSEEAVCFARPSIDVMFESAAFAFKQNVLGILLTGANEDGAKGLKTIQDFGGLTYVQDPREARSPFMPQSALALFTPTQVLVLESIGELLYGQGAT